jgi:hypothetical protein
MWHNLRGYPPQLRSFSLIAQISAFAAARHRCPRNGKPALDRRQAKTASSVCAGVPAMP